MKHLTRDALCAKLRSPKVMERAFAAEELGVRRDRQAVAPLLELLLAIEDNRLRDLDAAGFVMEALAAIGDPAATRPILQILRLTAGHMTIPEREPLPLIACRALVRLQATAALPALRELQLGRLAFLYRDLVARAIAALGGAAEAPFFEKLLGDGRPQVQAAAASALGMLRHRPAVPALELLSRSFHDEVRWAAIGALVALEQPASIEEFLAEARHLTDPSTKSALLYMTLDQGLTALAGPVFALSRELRWACSQGLVFDTLEVAAELGSRDATAYLRALHDDPQCSPCARARTAAILIAHGHDDLLQPCFELLRGLADPAVHDPRDNALRRNETQLELLDALERYGRKHRDKRALLAEGLYEILWNDDDDACLEEDSADEELLCYVPDRAGQALHAITGSSNRAELDLWYALQTPAN
jgi:HEAT repeat protein